MLFMCKKTVIKGAGLTKVTKIDQKLYDVLGHIRTRIYAPKFLYI